MDNQVMKFQKFPWKHDVRSEKYQNSKLFGAVTVFPKTLGKKRGPIENQLYSYRCTGYGNATEGWYIHWIRMSADWAAAKVGKVQGRTVDNYGGDPNACMKAMRDYGFLPKDLAPFSLEKDDLQASGWDVWPIELDKKVIDNNVGYVRVDPTFDTFEGIRSALVQSYDSKTGKGACVDAFGRWFSEWTYARIIPQTYNQQVGWHRYVFIDFMEENGVSYLVAQNSWGEIAGDKGFHLFPREVVNKEFTIAFTSLKQLKVLTQQMMDEAKKETYLGSLIRRLMNLYYQLSQIYGRFI